MLDDVKIAEALAIAAKAQLVVLESISEYLAQRRDEVPVRVQEPVRQPDPMLIHLESAPYVTVELAAAMTGLSAKAIRRKIEEGKWVEGKEFRRTPDGGVLISIQGFVNWIEGSAHQ